MNNFDKDQINKAINKFQEKHPQMVWHDVTKIKDVEYIDTISSQIEIIARKFQEDTDMYIICEMAKKYLEGARPVYPVRPQGEWVVDEFGRKICGKCQFPFAEFQSNNYCSLCGADCRGKEVNK